MDGHEDESENDGCVFLPERLLLPTVAGRSLRGDIAQGDRGRPGYPAEDSEEKQVASTQAAQQVRLPTSGRSRGWQPLCLGVHAWTWNCKRTC